MVESGRVQVKVFASPGLTVILAQVLQEPALQERYKALYQECSYAFRSMFQDLCFSLGYCLGGLSAAGSVHLDSYRNYFTKNKATRTLTKLKYIIGLLFVIILPVIFFYVVGVGAPAFCKYICPAGTLEAALPLLSTNPFLKQNLGMLFNWKLFLLLVTVIASIVIYRPFCRFICPLGAFYSLFNKLSYFGIQVDNVKCIGCDACIRKCKMDCAKVGDRECINCGECIDTCPVNAISLGSKVKKADTNVAEATNN